MDIHKPKPWHGLREFAKEFGTIVLGVLVALGAEQAVESLHRQAEVREARDTLRAEIAEDMGRAHSNQRREICGQSILRKWAAWADGGPRPPIGSTAFLELTSTNWDVVKAGPVSAMPLKEKLAFARFYGRVADYNTMAERERTTSIRLGEHYALKKLSADQADSLAKAALAETAIESVMAQMADDIQSAGARTGARMEPAPPQAAAELEAFCRRAGAS
jgi:hypothetical protein